MATTRTTSTRTTSPRAPKADPKPIKNWQNIEGRMRVYGNEFTKGKNDTFILYSTSVGSKREDGSWGNMYYNVRFRKNDDPQIVGAFDIDVNMAFLTVDEYDGKMSPAIMVLAFDFVEGE